MHDKHRIDHTFQVSDEVLLHIRRYRLQGEGKSLKPIRYGAFIIMEKIGDNAFRLDFPSYMQIYVVVNVEKLRLYEPPLVEYQGDNIQIPSIEYFSLEYIDEVQQETIPDRRTRSPK